MPFIGNPNSENREWVPQSFINNEGNDNKDEPLTPDHNDPGVNGYRNYYNFEEWIQFDVSNDPVNRAWRDGLRDRPLQRGRRIFGNKFPSEENFSLIVIAILLGIYFII